MITIVDYNAGNLRSVLRACQAVGAEAVITQDADAVARAERVIFPGVGAAYSAMVTLRATGLDAALRVAYERGTPILGICLGTQVILEQSEEVDASAGDAAGAQSGTGVPPVLSDAGSVSREAGSVAKNAGMEAGQDRRDACPTLGGAPPVSLPRRPSVSRDRQDACPTLGGTPASKAECNSAIPGGRAPGDVTPCLGILGGRVVRFRPTDPSQKVPHMGWNAVEFEREHPVLAGIPSGVEFYFVHSFYPDGLAAGDAIGWTEYATRFSSILGRGNLIATQFHAEKSGRFGLRLIENFTRWKP